MTYNFTTNIEKRMPDTGKVVCIDRMTSDYAQAHPFDVDAFIESVYQEFAGTEFEESREALHSVWTAVLSVTSPRGDASLYPNKNGQHRAAAMKVWHKAGDYWRRGLRLGDTLPDMVPMTKITRLDDGSWIALFPKDMHLLNEEFLAEPSGEAERRIKNEELTEHEPELAVPQRQESESDVTEPVRNQGEPQQLDLFAFQQLQQENERLRLQLSQQQAQPRPRRQRKPRVEHQQPVVSVAVPKQPIDTNLLKALGMVAAATVALFVIYETGLLIPLGLIGLATGGLLK